jgi:sugar phosphate isomerase/epimerase
MSSLTRRHFLSAAAAASSVSLLRAIGRSDFRLAVTTDEISEDLLEAARFLGRFHIGHAEIRNLAGKYNTEQPVAEIRKARKLLDEHRIQTCILDTGFFKVPLPAEDAAGQAKLDGQWALLDRAMERAAILGADRIRVFAFTHGRNETPDAKHYPRIYELVAEASRRARKRGLLLALENVGNSYVATAEHSAHLLKAVSDQALGLTWDPNNSAASGDPQPYPAGYEMLDPARILHVHFRDYRRLPGGKTEWCGVGEGEFDHAGQLRALQKDGYQGAISLETHYTIGGDKAKASEASLKGLLHVIENLT